MGIDNPDVIKAVGLFGGGISGTGDVCGALLGGIAFISSLYSRGTPDEDESPRMFKLGHMLDDRFIEMTKQFGGKDCSDIARVDFLDRDKVKAFYTDADSRRKYCVEVVGGCAQALGEIIEKEVLAKK